jgi:hypothetical protein
MSQFAFLYHGRADNPGSPEQRQQHLAKWRAWFQDLGDKGHLKELGHPLESGGRMVTGSQKLVTDGPFAEAKDVVGGFSIIEARDLAQATELSKGCPILDVEGAVEVRPVLAMVM